MEEANERLRKARIDAGFKSARAAALRFGWNPSTYSSHENGQTPVPRKAAEKYARAFKRSAGWILTGEGPGESTRNIVAVEGRVGAGAEIFPEAEQIPEGGLYPIEVQWALKEPMVAFEIVGYSMLPRYDPGYVVICYREGRPPDRMINEEVVTRLRDGRRFLKRLRRGTKPRKFNLESVNAPLIENVEPAWVGEIHVIVPPSQFTKLNE